MDCLLSYMDKKFVMSLILVLVILLMIFGLIFFGLFKVGMAILAS